MIILPSTTAVLRARLTGAPATTNPVFLFSYGDEPVSGQATGANGGALNGTTNTSLVGSPAASTSRVIRSGFIYNADTASVTVIVEYYDGTNASQIAQVLMSPNATLNFGDGGFVLGSETGAVGDMLAATYDPADIAEQLVGMTATQALTNKDLSDSTNIFPVKLQSQLLGINDQTGTSYTLALTDAGKDVRCNNASAIALTVPPNSSVAFPINTMIAFSQKGAGAVTATAGAGVTINAANGAATTAQFDARVLEKTDTDTWRVW